MTPTPARTITPGAVPETFSIVWNEDPTCTMVDVTQFQYPFADIGLFAVGNCRIDNYDTAMAWISEDGFTWRQVLSRVPGTAAWGVAADTTNSALVVGGFTDDGSPNVWDPVPSGAFGLTSLPSDGAPAVAQQAAMGSRSFFVVGTIYPEGAQGAGRPVAWIRDIDRTGYWSMVDGPTNAMEMRDVVDSSDYLVGSVGGRLSGEHFTVAGTTTDGESALWEYTPGRDWQLTELPDADDTILQLIDTRTALGTRTLWTNNGGWSAHDLGYEFQSASGTVLETDVTGVYVCGVTSGVESTGKMTVLYSADGDDWTVMPDQPEYSSSLVHAVTFLDDRVVGVGDAVYMGPLP